MIDWLSRYPKTLKWTSYTATFLYSIIIICWLCEEWFKTKFHCSLINLEAMVLIIGMLVSGINILQNRVISILEYSPAHALAIGYYKFLRETVLHLVKKGDVSPKICIYKPSSFEDLSKENIELVKSKLANKNFVVDILKMEFEVGRARDIITLNKNTKLSSYFDFPNTLTSLEQYVDYKLGSKENSFNNKEKAILMKKLIDEFYKKLFEQFPDSASDKSFKKITFCENDLKKFLK